MQNKFNAACTDAGVGCRASACAAVGVGVGAGVIPRKSHTHKNNMAPASIDHKMPNVLCVCVCQSPRLHASFGAWEPAADFPFRGTDLKWMCVCCARLPSPRPVVVGSEPLRNSSAGVPTTSPQPPPARVGPTVGVPTLKGWPAQNPYGTRPQGYRPPQPPKPSGDPEV